MSIEALVGGPISHQSQLQTIGGHDQAGFKKSESSENSRNDSTHSSKTSTETNYLNGNLEHSSNQLNTINDNILSPSKHETNRLDTQHSKTFLNNIINSSQQLGSFDSVSGSQRLLAASQLLYARLFNSNLFGAETSGLHVMDYSTDIASAHENIIPPLTKSEDNITETPTSLSSEKQPSDFVCSEKNLKFVDIFREQQQYLQLAKSFFNKYKMLEATLVQNMLDENVRKVGASSDEISNLLWRSVTATETMLKDVVSTLQILQRQTATAELYFTRAVQKCPTDLKHKIQISSMAKAAKALAHENENLKSSVGGLLVKQEQFEDNEDEPENVITTKSKCEKHEETAQKRTLSEIENQILDYALNINEKFDVDVTISSSPLMSPVCFWHPENKSGKQEKCGKDYALTAAEIILECASLTAARSNAKSTAEAVSTLASDLALKTVGIHNDSSAFNLEKISPTSSTCTTTSTASISMPSLGAVGDSLSAQLRNRRKPNFARRLETSIKEENKVISTDTDAVFHGSSAKPCGTFSTHAQSLDVTTAPTFTPFSTSLSTGTSTLSIGGNASIAALQERALTDMFKARFNALTAAAVAMNAAVPADVPYDLSVSSKFKQTNLDSKNSSSISNPNHDCKDSSNDKKKPHIKKPLNAFMLYMKEMRAKVVAECTLKESAAINQILGRRWHELSREEQSKYYEKARQERQLHQELYPGWSARDNYGYVSKKKKRKKDRSPADSGGNNMKKCRARFGLDQQNQWCKPCRRKKKCIRYMEAASGHNNLGKKDDEYNDIDGDASDDDDDDDNFGGGNNSCGDSYADDNYNKTTALDDDNETESLNQSLQSSPGCLSALSSLQSPATSLASPLSLLTSPAATPGTMLMPNLSGSVVENQQHLQLNSQHSLMQPQQQPQSSILPSKTALSTSSPSSSSSGGTSNLSSSGVSSFSNSSSSPASMSERMMRSLLVGGLNNRISNSTTANVGLHTAYDQLTTTIENPPPPLSSKVILPMPQNKAIGTSTTPPVSLTQSTPAGLEQFTQNLTQQRNPVGANPRDINNPLSINQLTKRNESNSGNQTALAAQYQVHFPTPTSLSHMVSIQPSEIPSQRTKDAITASPLFSSNFNQHFHHQLAEVASVMPQNHLLHQAGNFDSVRAVVSAGSSDAENGATLNSTALIRPPTATVAVKVGAANSTKPSNKSTAISVT